MKERMISRYISRGLTKTGLGCGPGTEKAAADGGEDQEKTKCRILLERDVITLITQQWV